MEFTNKTGDCSINCSREAVKSLWQLPHVCLSVCQSVHIDELGSRWKDFREILYWGVLPNVSRKFKSG